MLTACGGRDKAAFTPELAGQDLESGMADPVSEPAREPAQESTPFEAAKAEPFPTDARTYDRPWLRQDTMIVIDAYQGNSIDWDKMAKDKRVVAVIHRSSIGLDVDSLYRSRAGIAERRGYLWGAYHLGKSGDPIAQADLFLRTIGDPKKVLMVLDLEDTSKSTLMNVAGAKRFMAHVYQKTGRVPVVYANHNVTKVLNSEAKTDPLIKKSRLWYARFRSNIPDFPKGLWPTYFLWQFSSEINCTTTGRCLYNVPGTQFDMDVNVFYGSRAALETLWRQE